MTNLEKGIGLFGVLSTLIAAGVYIGSINGRLSNTEDTIKELNPTSLKTEMIKTINSAKSDINKLNGNLIKGSIGDVKYSVLNEVKFKELNGEGWTLMNGDKIPNSKLCKFSGICTLPDARGTFIRGMNENRSSNSGDSDGNRPVGKFQSDSFKSHSHPYVNAGVWNRSWKGDDSGPKTAHQKAGSTSLVGSKETRPRNITLFTYIKID
jgi:hypothetical protein